jgi:hypothetical protein
MGLPYRVWIPNRVKARLQSREKMMNSAKKPSPSNNGTLGLSLS